MRFLLLLLTVFLLNCEDKQSSKKSTSVVKDSIETVSKQQKDSLAKKIKAFEVLDEKNAMEFFLRYEKENKENKVRITTSFGEIEIELFEETKYHRANFIFLTKQHYFNNSQFYRVVPNFVIQAGNSDNPEIAERRNKIGRYLLPKDTKKGFVHDRGVLSMPSSEIENPHKMASPYEFFIVVQQGGSHHLDGDYTVFGRVTKGMEVADKIAAQETDNREWPLHNIYIEKVEIIE